MQELFPDTPKSLLPLGDKTVIDAQLKLLDLPDISDIFILSNEQYHKKFQDWHAVSLHPRIHIMSNGARQSSERRGAVGDMAFFVRATNCDDDLLILGNDNLFEESFAACLAFFKEKQGITIVVHPLEKTNFSLQANSLSLDPETKRIIAFASKQSAQSLPYIASLLYILPRKTVREITAYIEAGKDPDNAANLIQWLFEQGYPLYGYEMEGRRFDVGEPETYKDTIRTWNAR
ncbi:MAG: hypothetical protein A3C84_00075 [Candidatus Ryanbacteria bacterium RIFCSPHIGHO2_02_FULL_48_12]|jgi:glucose-1-phosphate thymidylyltransferase|nr:MAG: hypothetical protein A3C84_00075 [Candidatus Ryanbacteria bacterium RIFCSPHIGHO2_02_FULL_48_12]